MPTFHPTNIGYTTTGNKNGPQESTVTFGRTITGTYEGAGFGQLTRPDHLQGLTINFVDASITTELVQRGSVTLFVNDIISLIGQRAQFPTNLNLTLKEVLVCDAGQTKGMVVIGSQTYPTGSA